MTPEEKAATKPAAKRTTNNAKPSETPELGEQDAPEQIQISKIATETNRVPLIGKTPLIVHRFSEKAKKQMLDAMQGVKTPKTPKDPEAEYEAAFYRLADGSPGFPVLGLKSATVGAARFYGKEVTMTALRQFLFFHGEVGSDGSGLVRIIGDAEMREDVVRLGKGTDLRYRPQFMPWKTEVDVTYITSALTRDSVLGLIDAGGFGVGIGEW